MSDAPHNLVLPVLETKCLKCEGSGYFSEGPGDKGICDVCGGSGYVPTDAGKRVIALLRHELLKRKRTSDS
jgi:DnaJ-class molecular chaperone